MKYRSTFLFVVMLACSAFTGCKSFDLMKNEADTADKEGQWWKKDELPPVGSPAKIVAIWANSVFNQPGQGPVRGLGGRVYFYDAKHQPVRVEGQLKVFLYDDTDKASRDKQEATKQIDFTVKEVADSYTPSEFGPSYSFWVPWGEVGGERTQLSVIPVFTASAGEVVVGEQARYVLPGKRRQSDASVENAVSPVSYSRPDNTQDQFGQSTIQLQSTTIKVPHSVQERLRLPTTRKSWSDRLESNAKLNRPATSDQPRRPRTSISIDETDFEELPSRAGQRNRLPRGKFGQRPNTVRIGDISRPVAKTSTDSQQGSQADLPPDLLQARALQSAQQASAHDQNLLDRARSLFDRRQ